MRTYVVLLRGINVGGRNKVKMKTLKEHLMNVPFTNVKTYIQSGNILLSSEKTGVQIKKIVEELLRTYFDVNTYAIVRNQKELDEIVLNCPFTKEEIATAEDYNESASLYVAFLETKLEEDVERMLHELANDRERIIIQENNVYMLFHDSIRNSKLAKKLDKVSENITVRNWKSTIKIHSLL